MIFALFFSPLVLATTPTREVVHLVEFGGSWGPARAVAFTGFGPFGSITDNPSGRIVGAFAAEVSRLCPDGLSTIKKTVLPVRFGIIESIDLKQFDSVISVGVAAGTDTIRIERYAENWFEDFGQAGPITTTLPPHTFLDGPRLPNNLPTELLGFELELGQKGTGGTYVCNETFFRLCLHERKGYFIHIPNIPRSQDNQLASALAQLACRLFNQ